jgi:hypothetical protein
MAGMSEPIVIVATDATTDSADETGAVGAAAIEVAGDAFRQGVQAAESAGYRSDDTAAELAALRAEVAELRAAAGQAIGTAQAAAEIALDAADAVQDGSAGEGEGDGGEDGPRPPEPREEAPATPEAPAVKSEHTGYGAKGWFGARSG